MAPVLLLLAVGADFLKSSGEHAGGRLILRYENVCQGEFISRPNRFIAEFWMDGKKHIGHVKNTGRCKELFLEKAVVYLERSGNPLRKTAYSLIAVRKGDRLVNIDSQAPNKVFHEALLNKKVILPQFGDISLIRPEITYGGSRFDFYLERGSRRALVEVKGVTLEEDGVAKFPDAPTERGVKHLYELVGAKNEGYDVFIVFIIQMSHIRYFTPNDETHGKFGEALRFAHKNGVNVLAFECDVTPDSIEVNGNSCPVVL